MKPHPQCRGPIAIGGPQCEQRSTVALAYSHRGSRVGVTVDCCDDCAAQARTDTSLVILDVIPLAVTA